VDFIRFLPIFKTKNISVTHLVVDGKGDIHDVQGNFTDYRSSCKHKKKSGEIKSSKPEVGKAKSW